MRNSLNESFKGTIGKTYMDSTPEWLRKPAAPAGAPNVVFVVLDDVGFSDLGPQWVRDQDTSYGCPAAGGVWYSNFHVTEDMANGGYGKFLGWRNSEVNSTRWPKYGW